MIIDFIRNFYQYNAWANRRILDTAAQISPEQMRAGTLLPFGTVHNTLVHILGAQWLWLNRWQGISPRAFMDPQDFSDFTNLRARWDEIEAKTHEFVFACTDEDLVRVGSYRNFRDQEWSYPLWQQMLHQVNHATQHRSEVAMILSGWNCSPGSMDFLYFVDAELSVKK